MESPMLKAVLSHYVAQRDKVISELDIYLNRPSGVGEHAKVTDEVIRLFKELDEANGVIETVKNTIDNLTIENPQTKSISSLVTEINEKLNEQK